MANYFPVGYQPAQIVYPQQYQQPMMQGTQMPSTNQQMQNTAPNQPTMPPIQQSGFVRVQSENDARMYPVAPGNSVTFIDDNAPYCYVKTMDMSQLDRPKFDKYRLVKEEDASNMPVNAPKSGETATDGKITNYATKDDLDALWNEIDALKDKLKKPTPKKKESADDE